MQIVKLYINNIPVHECEIIYPVIESNDLLHRAEVKKQYVDAIVNEMKLTHWRLLAKHYNEYTFYLIINL